VDKYIVLYAKLVDDKELGILMTGIYIGGVCETEAQADEIATRCVSETQGGLILPKVTEIGTDNILDVIKELERQFDKLADTMYENERILKRNN